MAISHLLLQLGITGDIDPIRRLGWNVAAQTISTKILRGGLDLIVSIKPRPAPAVTRQVVGRVAVLGVLHHHEPTLEAIYTTDRACGHYCSRCALDLFHQDRSIRELARGTISLRSSRRGVNGVHLF